MTNDPEGQPARMIYLGIDPGLGGAIAAISADGSVEVFDPPTMTVTRNKRQRRVYDVAECVRLLARWERDRGMPARAAIEDVTPLPKMGAQTNFRFGYGLALWETALAALLIPFERVRPTVWRRALGIPAGADKDESRSRARELFPAQASYFERKKDDGRAEAALIAEYRRRQG